MIWWLRYPTIGVVRFNGAAYLATNQACAFVPSPTNKTLINLPRIVALGIAIVGGDAAWQEAKAQAQAITQINARVIATNIPGASAIRRSVRF